jgi:hypothetical protein
MSARHKARRRARYKEGIRRCTNCRQIKLCTLCYLPDTVREHCPPDEVLCYDCLENNCYCRSCGEFWGGIDSFEFTHPGLCDHCHDAIQSDFQEFEEGDESDYLCLEDCL